MDSDINGVDIQRVSVQSKTGSWLLSAMAHRQKKAGQNNTESGMLLSVSYGYQNWKFNSQFQSLEDEQAVSIGCDYHLGPSSKAYLWYTRHALDNKADRSWLAVGVEHRFQN